jgi:hypothetical protein
MNDGFNIVQQKEKNISIIYEYIVRDISQNSMEKM